MSQEDRTKDQLILEMRAIQHQRAEPLAMAVLDSFDIWCDIAETIGHPARMNARRLVERTVHAMDRMRAISSGIELPPRKGVN
jgi:hypothetical protein